MKLWPAVVISDGPLEMFFFFLKVTQRFLFTFCFRETCLSFLLTSRANCLSSAALHLNPWHGQTWARRLLLSKRSLFGVNKFLLAGGRRKRLINKLMPEWVGDASMLWCVRQQHVSYLKALFLFQSGTNWVAQTTTAKYIKCLLFESHSSKKSSAQHIE